jgi:hypothetical protein
MQPFTENHAPEDVERIRGGTPRGGDRHPWGWSGGTPRGGDRHPLGTRSGPLGVVNRSLWGGDRDPPGWSVGTLRGGDHHPSAIRSGPFGVVRRSLQGGDREPEGSGEGARGVRQGYLGGGQTEPLACLAVAFRLRCRTPAPANLSAGAGPRLLVCDGRPPTRPEVAFHQSPVASKSTKH